MVEISCELPDYETASLNSPFVFFTIIVFYPRQLKDNVIAVRIAGKRQELYTT